MVEENERKMIELKRIIKKLEIDNKELHKVCIKKQAENDHLKKTILEKYSAKENAPPTRTPIENTKPQFQEIYNKIVRGIPERNESHKTYIESSKIALDKKRVSNKESATHRAVSQLRGAENIHSIFHYKVLVEDEGKKQHRVNVWSNTRGRMGKSMERGIAVS
jgi:hypothetical protein